MIWAGKRMAGCSPNLPGPSMQGVKPLVDDERFSLETVAQAYEKLSDGRATGKVVIDI